MSDDAIPQDETPAEKPAEAPKPKAAAKSKSAAKGKKSADKGKKGADKGKKGAGKKGKKGAGGSGGPSVAATPRAAAQVRRAKGWGGLVGFAAAAYFSYRASVPPEATMVSADPDIVPADQLLPVPARVTLPAPVRVAELLRVKLPLIVEAFAKVSE